MISIGCEDKRTLYRIGPHGIDRVKNGTGGVLIVNGGAPELDDFSATGELARWLREDTWADPVGRLLLALYAPYAALGAQTYSERPLLAGIGGKGSGKTTTLQLLGQAVFGHLPIAQPYGAKARGMEKRLLNERLAIIDNLESPPARAEESPEDFFATACTSSQRSMDKLFTSCDVVKVPLTAFCAVTSICVPACLKRTDVAERLLVVGFRRPADSRFGDLSGRTPDRRAVWRDILQMLYRFDRGRAAVPRQNELRIGSFARLAHTLLPEAGAMALEQTILAEQGNTAGTDDPIAQALEVQLPAQPQSAKTLLDFWATSGALETPPGSAKALGNMLDRRRGVCGPWEIIGERDKVSNLTLWSFRRAKVRAGLTDLDADRLLGALVAAGS